MDRRNRLNGWQDVVELVVAIWLFVSPFVLDFFVVVSAALTALSIGIASIFISQLGISKQQPWEEWVNLLLAAFLVFSPWILGYTQVVAAMWNAVITGLVLAVFAVIALINEYREFRRERLEHPRAHGPV